LLVISIGAKVVVSQLDRAGFICGTMAPMAKKKTQGKKHKFKYAEASPNVQVEAALRSSAAVLGSAGAQKGRFPHGAVSPGRDFSYVGSDLRRIVIMAVALVAIEVGLWALLAHTQLGDIVYRLVLA
jgi:hypothetical protein